MKGQIGVASFENASAIWTWLHLVIVTWRLSGTLRTVLVEITQFAPKLNTNVDSRTIRDIMLNKKPSLIIV